MNYDRGWDEKPARRRDRKVLREILAGFPDRPREKANDEPPAPERKSRRRFVFGKTRSSKQGAETMTITSADQSLLEPSCSER